jgi:hypothetical protein
VWRCKITTDKDRQTDKVNSSGTRQVEQEQTRTEEKNKGKQGKERKTRTRQNGMVLNKIRQKWNKSGGRE